MDGIDTSVSAGGLAKLRPAATTATPARTAAVTATTQTGVGAANANLISLLADASPPIDSKKVEAIRSLIAAGRYPIDSRAIAAKMIALDAPAPHDV